MMHYGNMMVEYKLPIITVNTDGSLRGKGGLLEDEAVEFTKMLDAAGIDMIQVAQANHTGNMGDTIRPMGAVPYNWTLRACEKVKAVVSCPIATVGRVVSVEAGEKILEDGTADIIGYGRSLLTDPDNANKVEKGECLNCNKCCVDAIQSRCYLSCVLNAENGDEETIFIQPCTETKNVAIVGAGLAGLEAARVTYKRGHTVTVFEKSDRLGGQINIASVPPRKDEILRSVQYYEKFLPGKVDIQLNHEPAMDELNGFDHVILAIGAHNMDLLMPVENSNIVSSWDILNGQEVSGKCVVLGRGLVGDKTAEYLANKGLEVSIVEMMDKIAAQESETVLPLMEADFKEHSVQKFVNTRVSEIKNNVIYAVNTKDEINVEITVDTIVNALGSKKNVFDDSKLTVPFTYVGDCSGERTADIASAIRTGYKAANEI